MRISAAILLLAAAGSAATLETWQTFEAPFLSRGRTSIIMHSQIRERNYFSDMLQGRVGPVFRVTLSPRATLLGGYYYGEVTQTEHHWGNNHRTLGGVEFPTAFAGGVLAPRVVIEYHFGGSGAPSAGAGQG